MRAKYVSIEVASGRDAAERWRKQYQNGQSGKWTDTSYGSSEDRYKRLCALGPNPDIQSVADIIGNKGWSYISCDGCPEYVERAVRIGEYDGKTYCPTCIAEAAKALSVDASAIAERIAVEGLS